MILEREVPNANPHTVSRRTVSRRTGGRILIVTVAGLLVVGAIAWGPALWWAISTEDLPHRDPRAAGGGLPRLPAETDDHPDPAEVTGTYRIRRGWTVRGTETIRHGAFRLLWHDGGPVYLEGSYDDGVALWMTQYHRDGTIAAQWRQARGQRPEIRDQPPWWSPPDSPGAAHGMQVPRASAP